MNDKDLNRVLIVGCGQLGSRHLQAISALELVQEIEVVDPRPEGLQLGQERIREVHNTKTIRWFPSIESATPGGGLCIIATQAQERYQALRSVANTLGYSSFILEKIVSPSSKGMDETMHFARDASLSVWVNFKTRAYNFHKIAKARIEPEEPVIFSSVGSNFGLANAIHDVDLFAYYDEATCIKHIGSRIDPVLHSSKRGKDLYDLSGSIYGYTDKGSHFSLSLTQDSGDWAHISIATPRYRCIVDHLQRRAFESEKSNGWSWKPAVFDGPILVSEMTQNFAANILEFGDCELPTLEESSVSHKFLLSELQPYFSQLLGRTIEECPVT